jgi:hypothetical protein
MKTMAERHARLRYWALVRRTRDGGVYGFAADFYPEEAVRHRLSYRRQGYTILGTYDDAESAVTAIRFFIARSLSPDTPDA